MSSGKGDFRTRALRLFASPATAGQTAGPVPVLKSAAEIDELARAGAAVRDALAAATSACVAGATTSQVDRAASSTFVRAGATPLFAGYRQGNSPPFPADTCVSVNEEVVHGVPGPRVLKPGDVVSVDVGLRLGGWCADAATTIVVQPNAGAPIDDALRARLRDGAALVARTRDVLAHAIDMIRPGVRWSVIARALEDIAVRHGHGVVAEYVGHGIGRDLHEAPKAPAYWTGYVGDDFVLQPGLVLAIEPILTLRAPTPRTTWPKLPDGWPAWRVPVRIRDDGWTVFTATGDDACHEEHMVAVTQGPPRVLTA